MFGGVLGAPGSTDKLDDVQIGVRGTRRTVVGIGVPRKALDALPAVLDPAPITTLGRQRMSAILEDDLIEQPAHGFR